MFTEVSLQAARHDSGYIVSVDGPEAIAYEDDQINVRVESDLMSTVIPLYVDSLRITQKNPGMARPSVSAQEVLMRIQAALDYLKISSELV